LAFGVERAIRSPSGYEISCISPVLAKPEQYSWQFRHSIGLPKAPNTPAPAEVLTAAGHLDRHDAGWCRPSAIVCLCDSTRTSANWIETSCRSIVFVRASHAFWQSTVQRRSLPASGCVA